MYSFALAARYNDGLRSHEQCDDKIASTPSASGDGDGDGDGEFALDETQLSHHATTILPERGLSFLQRPGAAVGRRRDAGRLHESERLSPECSVRHKG
jgi:hypothetical protein